MTCSVLDLKGYVEQKNRASDRNLKPHPGLYKGRTI